MGLVLRTEGRNIRLAPLYLGGSDPSTPTMAVVSIVDTSFPNHLSVELTLQHAELLRDGLESLIKRHINRMSGLSGRMSHHRPPSAP